MDKEQLVRQIADNKARLKIPCSDKYASELSRRIKRDVAMLAKLGKNGK